MTAWEIIGLLLAFFVMLVGVAGAALPGLPGTPLVLAAALLHKLAFGPHGAAWWVLVLLGLLMALAHLVDYVASVYGARRLGATWRGALGAILGGLAGLFFLPFGILVGPFIGAFVLELAGDRHWKAAGKAGLGATLGLVIGTAAKVAIAMVMIVMFVVNVLWRSLGPVS